jgi:Na+/H+ antiporter NhaD/arsenite permease-like protein
LLDLLGDKLVAATGGNMAHAGYAILWASAFLSAIVDNIPFVATMIPLIKSMAPAYGGADKIEPLGWCLSLGARLGGNGTLIGASANLTVSGISDRNGAPFPFYHLHPLRFADDGRVGRNLPRLCLVAVFLGGLHSGNRSRGGA